MTEVTRTEQSDNKQGQSGQIQDESPKKRSRILLILAAMGPGVIAAMAGNDAGGISTYSTAGAKFGYMTLWAIPVMCILLIVVQTAATRMGVVTMRDVSYLRIFAGTDDPLYVADSLDQALRLFCNPPEPL